MRLSDADRARRYRRKKKGLRGHHGFTRYRTLNNGDMVNVFTVGAIADEAAAATGKDAKAIRATLQRWQKLRLIPDSGFPQKPNAARVYDEKQKNLIVKLYCRHVAQQKSITEVSLWLAARWEKVNHD